MLCEYDRAIMTRLARKPSPRSASSEKPGKTAKDRGSSASSQLAELESRGQMTTVNLPPDLVEFLARRGALPDLKRGPRNRSRIMRRKLQFLQELFERANPLITRDFPKSYVEVLTEVIPEPWNLSPDEISLLEHIVARRPSLARIAKERAVDIDDLVRRIAELDFAERFTLVDLLEQSLADSPSIR
jgi:hypothetical protein